MHRFLLAWSLVSLLLLVASSQARAQGDDVCLYDPANLAQNCTFDEGLNHWSPFILSGNPSIRTIDGNPACHAPLCPALYLASTGAFEAGVYQQLPATPGFNYFAQLGWFVWNPTGDADNVVLRQLGIDPTGGLDPSAPSVVWGQEVWMGIGNCPNRFCPGLNVTATARNSVITVFLRVRDTYPARPSVMPAIDEFWTDDLGVISLGEAPVATELPPTATPPPPADTPVPPTATSQPVSTPSRGVETSSAGSPIGAEELVVQVEPTATEAPSPTVTPSPSATASPTVTVTPLPTRTSTAAPSPIPATQLAAPIEPFDSSPVETMAGPTAPDPTGIFGLVGGTAVCLGVAGLLTLSLTVTMFFYFYRIGSREFEEELLDPRAAYHER